MTKLDIKGIRERVDFCDLDDCRQYLHFTLDALEKTVEALGSISRNGCCDNCQEAKFVALKVLKELGLE